MARKPEPRRYVRGGREYVRVTLSGNTIHLGPADEPAVWEEGWRLVRAWEEAGRVWPIPNEKQARAGVRRKPATAPLIGNLIPPFLEWARATHHPNRYSVYEQAMGLLEDVHTFTAAQFGAPELKHWRNHTLRRLRKANGDRYAHSTLAEFLTIVKQLATWAEDDHLATGVPVGWAGELSKVPMWPQDGRDSLAARRVGAVPEYVLEATLPHLSPTLQNAVKFQLATGRRSGEFLDLTWEQIDRGQEPWRVVREQHKTAKSTGSDLLFGIGPLARECLQAQMAATGSMAGVVFPTPAGRAYRSDTYRSAIQRAACLATWELWTEAEREQHEEAWRAKLTSKQVAAHRDQKRQTIIERIVWNAMRAGAKTLIWHPHQLRHNAEQRAEAGAGVMAGKDLLGNRTLDATEAYRKSSEQRQLEMAERFG
jgi:integrase